jgi:hypothetical protein
MNKGWGKILKGYYRYTNAAGKTLAIIERTGAHWHVTVFMKGDAAGEVNLSAKPRTMREARALAESSYKSLTVGALKRERAELARLGY